MASEETTALERLTANAAPATTIAAAKAPTTTSDHGGDPVPGEFEEVVGGSDRSGVFEDPLDADVLGGAVEAADWDGVDLPETIP